MSKENLLKEEITKIIEKRNEQKQRGVNDYNLLTTVLSANDEVRLHSRVIHSLLDRNGSHYQDTFFLKLFLNTIGETEFFNNLSNVSAKKETDEIDILLTNGEKYIIIENKINAGDQEKQINRYVDKLLKNRELDSENILVIYLSIDRKVPTSYSLGKLTVKNMNGLYENEKKIATFKSVHYQKHIVEWLEDCKQQIENNSNLWISLSQYENAVKKVLEKPHSVLKSFDQLFYDNFQYVHTFHILKDNKEFKQSFIEVYEEILDSYKYSIKERFANFLEILCSKLLKDDSELSLGEFEIFRSEPYFDLNYKEIRFSIYLMPDRKMFNNNFFNFKSIALRPTRDWSIDNTAPYQKVEERDSKFKEYLQENGLDKFLVGNKQNKGLKIKPLENFISLEQIFNTQENYQDIYDFQDVKKYIREIKDRLKI